MQLEAYITVHTIDIGSNDKIELIKNGEIRKSKL
tara:strand:+ start:325 stop:426 length:102 start_codon:yes stop_codon:yes gene_type:complete